MTEGLQIAMLVSIATAYLWAVAVRKSLSLVQFRVAFVGMAAIFGISPIVVAVSRNQDLGLADYSRFALYAIAMVCFIVAYEITRPAAHHRAAEDNYDPLFRVVGWTFILAGVLAFGVLVDRYGLEFFWMAKSDVYLLSAEDLGPEKFAKDLVMIGATILAYDACRRRRLGVSFFMVYVATLALGVVLSRRSMLLTMLAALAFYYHHSVRPLRTKVLVGIGVGFLFIGGAWNQVYGFLLGYSGYAFSFTDRDWWAENNPFFQLRSSDEIWANVWNGQPELGRTYINALKSVLVPRFLGGTTDSLNTWYTARYFGELVGTGAGFAFSELVESYINFGLIGPLMVLSVLGVLARKADTASPTQLLFLRGVAFGSVQEVFMGEFVNLLKFQIVLFCVVPYALYWALSFLREVMRSVRTSDRPT